MNCTVPWLLRLPLITLVMLCCATAGETEMLSRNWNGNSGLPQDHIRAMTRTRDGFLWLATDAGLARFDGSTFKTFGPRDGVGSVVMSLLESRDGALWIATLGGGISVLRNGRIEKTYQRGEGLSGSLYPTLGEDAEGRIWVNGSHWLEGGKFVPVPGAPADALMVFSEAAGTIWVARGGRRISRWKDGVWSDGSGGGPVSAVAIHEDAKGRLWVASADQELWCREAGVWRKWPPLPGIRGRVSSLTSTPDGTLWIAYYREGVRGLRDGRILEPKTGNEIFLDLAEQVLGTPDGLLWVGTSTNGLYSLQPSRVEWCVLDDEMTNRGANFIGALVESAPGEFLMGSQGRGLFRWRDGKSELVGELGNYNRGLFVNSMLHRDGGISWIGTGAGLFKLGEADGVPLRPVHERALRNVWELCEDGSGGLWVGTGNGELHHLTNSLVRVKYGSNQNDPIKGLARAPDGTLWIGTRGNGLFRLQSGKWTRFGLADGLASEVIRAIHCDADGDPWVGTGSGGLSVWRGNGFHTITTADGLPDDIISQITGDAAGRVWLGTNRGLAILEKQDVARFKSGAAGPYFPVIVNRADGFRAEECTIVPPVTMSDGRLAFATTRGVGILNPQDFQPENTIPPVFIERVLANGIPVGRTGGRITLPPGVERLEIEYTGLHFTAPNRLRFRNRLTGLEGGWDPGSEQRRVEYRNLAPGDYRFEVAGSIENGLWSPQPAGFDLTLEPHFWQTLWFRIATGASVVGLAVFAARAQERARSRRKIETLKREQAVQAERARIARDLHDDVGASLTQVALLSELADSDLDADPELARGHINEIFTTAKEVTRSLDEIVWAVNPAQDTLERFAAFLGTFVQNYARAAGLNGRLDIPDQLPDIPLSSAVRHHLYLATKEVLHNIVKHAGASEVRLHLIPDAGQLRLIIGDNGRGLDPHDRSDGDGLGNLGKRLDQIGGSCTHRSVAGQGTSVEMTVPLGN